MAAKRVKIPRLTAGEIELLGILWQAGSVTIAEAQRLFPRPVGYTTVQTRLNRLVKKGVALKSDDRPARYAPAITREQVSAGDLRFLLDGVTGGRVVPLVAHLVRERSLPRQEIEDLKRLIAEVEARSLRPARKRGPP